MFLMLISAAAALEGMPGQWLPGASPLSARQGWIGAGVAWDWSGPGGASPGLLMRGVVGAGPRLAINAEGHLTRGDPISDLGIGIRRIVWNQEGFRLAPFGHLEFSGDTMDGIIGMSGQVDGSTLDFDASLSLLTFRAEEGAESATLLLPPQSMTALDAGITIAPASQQELRMGILADERVRLSLGYRWLGPWWLISADLLLWPNDTGARLVAAARF
ncbi:MAG: hypothetical protein P8R54_14440 [Myxococcota bacterium]|nr:hypothetical protein [Myxococcota bacterium]